MKSKPSRSLTLAEAATYTPHQVVDLAAQVERLNHQLEWFKRQIFGRKSEKRPIDQSGIQGILGEGFGLPEQNAASTQKHRVNAHERTKRTSPVTDEDSGAFFDESRVPMEEISVRNPEVEGLSPDQYEVIGEKVSYRLAQRPASYVVLKYVRPVIKRKDTQVLSCPPAPVGVIEGSRADVSFIAGMMIDKFAYHNPLYRQHQRLQDSGFRVSRPWLTQLMAQGASLLEPIYFALLRSICASRLIVMDETPMKAGRVAPGQMKVAYFWPIYGEQDEVCFPFFENRRHENVHTLLGLSPGSDKILLSDGYAAYAAYAKKTGLTHAQCWAHTRRIFFDAQDAEPEASKRALEYIGALYAVEEVIRDRQLKGDKKHGFRLDHAKPVVEQFFAWMQEQWEHQGFLPSNPFTKALNYARERRAGLEVYLSDPAVPIDTNHLERSLRVIPMGRRNWLFSWTEVGAKQVGIIQSLIVTCRLHGINPYDYLVDVLQRVGQHPAADVAQLTPRLWKEHFAANPLRSDLSATISI